MSFERGGAGKSEKRQRLGGGLRGIGMIIIPAWLMFAAMAWLGGCVTGRGPAVTGGPASGDAEATQRMISPGHEPHLARDEFMTLLRKRVKYVFVLYQENRSFDSDFGTFPGAEGLYWPPGPKRGFAQEMKDTNGRPFTVRPFRIPPSVFPADTGDVDHSHSGLVAKMDVVDGVARMDRFAAAEQEKRLQRAPALKAMQYGELTMGYLDGDTIPFLWRYANRFVLFDHVFQLMAGPSTLGNLSIIAAQTGQTQAALHPNERFQGNGDKGPGEPVMDDLAPYWGSRADTNNFGRMPNSASGQTQFNQTYATLPLSMLGEAAAATAGADKDKKVDLGDVQEDVEFLTAKGQKPVAWGWFQEGYSTVPVDPNDGPTDAYGLHASYITHHNGPQYFGYIANNPKLSANIHGLGEFFEALTNEALPPAGGLFFVKGGYRNMLGLKPKCQDPLVQKSFRGDDDHPGYSDAQISEALLAKAINAIARSRYWSQSAIIITWDDSEGNYDHVAPPIRSYGPDHSVISDGPRVPLIILSPYARAHAIAHETGDHGSVVKFADALFGLQPLATLPDEQRGREAGKKEFDEDDWGPDDARTSKVSDLTCAFDPARLEDPGKALPPEYAIIPDEVVTNLGWWGMKDVGVQAVPPPEGVSDAPPANFSPRP